jgi:hypothetical protein
MHSTAPSASQDAEPDYLKKLVESTYATCSPQSGWVAYGILLACFDEKMQVQSF